MPLPPQRARRITRQTTLKEMAGWQVIAQRELLQHRRAIVVLAVSALCLLLLEYYVIRGVFWQNLRPWLAPFFTMLGVPARLQPNVGWALGCVLAYTLLPALTIKLLLRDSIGNYGVKTAGYWRHLPLYLLLVSPVLLSLLLASRQPAFQQSYPFYWPNSAGELLIWELAYLAQFAALEFFFRGFMVHGLRPSLGRSGAVLFMVLPYMMIHYSKPWLEAGGAVVAGLVLGGLSLATRSIWGGVTMHGLVALSMDLLALYHRGWFE